MILGYRLAMDTPAFLALELDNAPVKDDEVMDPDTAEDTDSTKVATEIAAYNALQNLGGQLGGAQTVKAATTVLKLIIDDMTKLEAKVLAQVVKAAQRPYNLSDFAWLHILRNVAARRGALAAKVPQTESMQGYLEPRLSTGLKKRLRQRFPAAVATKVTNTSDEETGKVTTVTEIVGKAFLLKEVIRVPMADMLVDPKAEVKAIDAAIKKLAAQLEELDNEFGIIGTFQHVTLQKLAVTDLSSPMFLYVAPMTKATTDAPFRKFDWVYNIDGFRPNFSTVDESPVINVREYTREDFLKEARSIALSGNPYAGDDFFRKAEKAGFQREDNLGVYVEAEQVDGSRIRIRPRPSTQTQPEGVEVPKVGLDAFSKREAAPGIVIKNGDIPFNKDVSDGLKEVIDQQVAAETALVEKAKAAYEQTVGDARVAAAAKKAVEKLDAAEGKPISEKIKVLSEALDEIKEAQVKAIEEKLDDDDISLLTVGQPSPDDKPTE